METETIDRLFLELSQVTRATTSKELTLQALVDQLRAENARLREAIVEAMYWERCAAHEDTVEGRYSPYTLAEYAREDSVIERLDAARKGVR